MKKAFCNIVIERPRVHYKGARPLGSALNFVPKSGTIDECEEWYDEHAESRISNSAAKRGNISRGTKRSHGATKELNDNLGPIRRFLRSRLGRPWDDVYSEVRAVFKNGGMAQEHALGHLIDAVRMDVKEFDGVLCFKPKRYGGFRPLEYGYYVDPLTGLLSCMPCEDYREFQRAYYRESLLYGEVYFVFHPPHKYGFAKVDGNWLRIDFKNEPNQCQHLYKENYGFWLAEREVWGIDLRDTSVVSFEPVTSWQGDYIAEVIASPRIIPSAQKRASRVWLVTHENFRWVPQQIFAVYAVSDPSKLWS